jgi:hypothetical protein
MQAGLLARFFIAAFPFAKSEQWPLLAINIFEAHSYGHSFRFSRNSLFTPGLRGTCKAIEIKMNVCGKVKKKHEKFLFELIFYAIL